jgi:hypothetical protein
MANKKFEFDAVIKGLEKIDAAYIDLPYYVKREILKY